MNATHKRFILTKLIPFIQREGGNGFVMEDWIAEDLRGLLDEEFGETTIRFDGVAHRVPSCNTAACIGGSVELLKGIRRGNSDVKHAKALGLTVPQAKGLFYSFSYPKDAEIAGWPSRFAKAFQEAKTPRGKAGAAVRLLKHVVATEGKCLNPVDEGGEA